MQDTSLLGTFSETAVKTDRQAHAPQDEGGHVTDVKYRCEDRCEPFMLNTRSEEEHPVFYSDLACLVNTSTLNMYGFLSCSRSTRRNTLFIFL